MATEAGALRGKRGGQRPDGEILDPEEMRQRSKPLSRANTNERMEIRREEKRKLILTALRAGNTRRDSHTYAGVSPSRFADWINRDPEFSNAVVQAEAAAKVSHVTTLTRAAQQGAWQASLAWLERRFPREWGKMAQLDVQLRNMDREQLIATLAERLGLTDGSGATAPLPEGGGGSEVIEGEVIEEE